MAEKTLSKILDLVSNGTVPDLRLAAVQVLGAIEAEADKNVAATLLAVLDDADQALRIAAIHALGQLRVEHALEKLEGFVRQGGAELEPAVHAASLLGARGARLMGKVSQEASPSLRSRIATVLAKSNTGNALVITAQSLLDENPKVIEATARSLAMEIPAYSASQRSALAKFLIESLHAKKIAPPSEAALLRVLAALHEAKAEEIFWARILPPHTPDVRAAALQALGTRDGPTSEKRLQALLTCAADKNFNVLAAALMILDKVHANAKNSRHWIKLLEAADVAARRFAVEKMQGVESEEVATAMLPLIRHPDRALREAAIKTLQNFAAGRAAILAEMLATEELEQAWALARVLAPTANQLKAGPRASVFAQAIKYFDADDRRSAALFFLLRETDHAWTRDRIEAKAEELRKKKKYEHAVRYYRLLAQDPACGEEIRFGLAAAGLKDSTHELSLDRRGNDPALHQFARLLQNADFDLIGHVAKAKWLEAADLFYLGFHFTEQSHRAQDFGKQVLELVIKRSPQSDLGKQARRKLKSV